MSFVHSVHFDCLGNGGDGGPGLAATDGSLAYLMGCQLFGGMGGLGQGPCGGDDGDGGAAIQVWTPDTKVVVTNVTLVGGTGNYGQAPPTDGYPIKVLGIGLRELIAPSVVREGETTTWTIRGRPGDAVFLPASLSSAWRFLPSASGVQTFDFPTLEPLMLVGIVGPESMLTLQVPSQTLPPGTENLTTYHQVFVIDASGQRILGAGRAVVTIDASF